MDMDMENHLVCPIRDRACEFIIRNTKNMNLQKMAEDLIQKGIHTDEKGSYVMTPVSIPTRDGGKSIKGNKIVFKKSYELGLKMKLCEINKKKKTA